MGFYGHSGTPFIIGSHTTYVSSDHEEVVLCAAIQQHFLGRRRDGSYRDELDCMLVVCDPSGLAPGGYAGASWRRCWSWLHDPPACVLGGSEIRAPHG
jgi:hypothetical protein